MTTLDARPQWVPLAGYGGDTLTVRVIVSDYAAVAGRRWDAQVRREPTSSGVDATFSIVPPAASGQPGVLTLSAADAARLADMGTEVRVREGTQTLTVKRYEGVWDCQVSLGSEVRTLVRGSIIIDKDITRLS